MASERTDEEKFSTIIIGALSVTVILLLIAPMIFVIGKDTAYSAYEFPEEETEQLAQITDMRKDMVDQENYYVANTMSTPM